jgi:uncharacterized protein
MPLAGSAFSLLTTGVFAKPNARALLIDADKFEKRFGVAGPRLQKKLDDYIPLSRAAIKNHDAAFFRRLSVMGEAWRVFPEFAGACVYLDIETTGLSTVFDTLTIVGLYDGRRYSLFMQGENLDELQRALRKYSVVVTFNGAGFDLRFLKAAFPSVVLPPIHIDLRWVSRKLGYKGGLKELEQNLGIARKASVAEMNGYDATVLWARHLRGDRSALDQLIEYNTEDVVHLKAIMEICYDEMSHRTAIAFKHTVAPVFSGVAEIPKHKKGRITTVRKLPTRVTGSFAEFTYVVGVRCRCLTVCFPDRTESALRVTVFSHGFFMFC